MTITELGAIGELVGGLAVIGTLVYLAIQVRHNTKEMRVSSQLEVFNQQDRFTAMIVDNPAALGVWKAATGDPLVHRLANPDGLSADELSLFSMVMFRSLNHQQMQWSIWRSGNLSDDSWAYAVTILRAYVRTPAAVDWWSQSGRWVFQSGFVELVDRLVREEAATDSWPAS